MKLVRGKAFVRAHHVTQSAANMAYHTIDNSGYSHMAGDRNMMWYVFAVNKYSFQWLINKAASVYGNAA